jgi:hypothetical protein
LESPEDLNHTYSAPQFSQCPYCQKQAFHQSNPWTWECSSCKKKLIDKEAESRYTIPGVEGCQHTDYDYCRALNKAHSPATGYSGKRKGEWLLRGVVERLEEIRKSSHPEILLVVELGEPKGEEHKHPDVLVVFKDGGSILIECKNIIPYYGYHTINSNYCIEIRQKNWNGGTYYFKHSNPGGKLGGLKPIPFQIIDPRRVIVITVTAFLTEQDENRLRRRFELVELGHAYLPSTTEEPTFKDPQPECMEKVRERLRGYLTSLIENPSRLR